MFLGVIILLFGISVVSCTDCPNTWVSFLGSCYYFSHGVQLTFVEAEHFCRQHHDSHLVHVDNADENLFIKDYLRQLKPNIFWMGLSDQDVEALWMWYDTGMKATFTDWHPGQPDNANAPGEDCAEFNHYFNFQWDDHACDSKFLPICEISGLSEPTVVG